MGVAARLAFFLCLFVIPCAFGQSKPDLVLEGTVTGQQNQTYFEIPFEVPTGVRRISVDFTYNGRDKKTTMDLGVADPQRFRGNSGGNKNHFTIGEADATPSYLPGPIPAGRWRLLVSVPNIRANEKSTYHAEVRFNSPIEEHSFTPGPLVIGTRWYRGDLHMHTAHSDGSCTSQSGKSVPCPTFLTAEAAASRGLDFIAITDHNTTSQYDDMRELQPYFDKLLLIPGREITTFWGHFNIFGVTEFVDYRVTSGGLDVNAILRDVRAKGGIASVNHADSPTGEICMGCGWTPKIDVDMSLFTGVEVINGGGLMLSSEDFWDRQIAKGARLTAIGGSDNHHATSEAGRPGSIGWPTTVVEATELSVPGILEGIRRGRVFIDLTASHDKMVDLEARDSAESTGMEAHIARMGQSLDVSAGDSLNFQVHLTACPLAKVYLFLDGIEDPLLPPLDAGAGNGTLPFRWKTDDHAHWIRAEVRDSNGSLMLVSNPIYIHPLAH